MGLIEHWKKEQERLKKRMIELQRKQVELEREEQQLKNELSQIFPTSNNSRVMSIYNKEVKVKLKNINKELKKTRETYNDFKTADVEIPFVSKLIRFGLLGEVLMPIFISLLLLRTMTTDDLIDRSFNIVPKFYTIVTNHQPSEQITNILLMCDYIITEAIIIFIISFPLKYVLTKRSIKFLKVLQIVALISFLSSFFIIGLSLSL